MTNADRLLGATLDLLRSSSESLGASSVADRERLLRGIAGILREVESGPVITVPGDTLGVLFGNLCGSPPQRAGQSCYSPADGPQTRLGPLEIARALDHLAPQMAASGSFDWMHDLIELVNLLQQAARIAGARPAGGGPA